MLDEDDPITQRLLKAVSRDYWSRRLRERSGAPLVTLADLDEGKIIGIAPARIQAFLDVFNDDVRAFNALNLRKRAAGQPREVVVAAFGPEVNAHLTEAVATLAKARQAEDPYEGLDARARLAWNAPELVELYKHERKFSTNRVRDVDFAFRLFGAIVRDKTVAQLTPVDVSQFLELLQKLPNNYNKKLKTEDPRIAVERAARSRKSLPGMAPATIIKHLGNIKRYLSWAKRKQLLKVDPGAEIEYEVPRSLKVDASEQRHPYSIEELNLIFQAPVFTGAKSRGRPHTPGDFSFRRHHYFWAPLLALFTGAREHEIGQLEVHDIIEFNERPHFDITDEDELREVERSISGDRSHKKLKSLAAKRRVPVHPALIEIGFLEYVEWVKNRGHARLFPLWEVGARGYYSDTFGKFWNATDNGFLTKVGIKRPRLSFHSFRHTFQDAMDDAGIQESTQIKIIGHSNGGVRRRYRRKYLRPAESAAYDRIAYSGLKIEHLISASH